MPYSQNLTAANAHVTAKANAKATAKANQKCCVHVAVGPLQSYLHYDINLGSLPFEPFMKT